jgi:hypothetical protein
VSAVLLALPFFLFPVLRREVNHFTPFVVLWQGAFFVFDTKNMSF